MPTPTPRLLPRAALLPPAALLALAAVLLLAAPAAAHPAIAPDPVPVDSHADLELRMAHGCTADEDGDGQEQSTRRVALQVPGAVDHVEPSAPDGWTVTVEPDDGPVEVVEWTAEEGAEELAPALPLRAVHRGEVGDEIVYRVVQACDDLEMRWVAADGEEGDPAVTVTVGEADPDAPAPPPQDPPGGSPAADDGQDMVAESGPADDAGDDADGVGEDADADGSDDAAGDGEADGETAGAQGDDGGGLPGWLLPVALAMVIAALGGLLVARSRRTGP